MSPEGDTGQIFKENLTGRSLLRTTEKFSLENFSVKIFFENFKCRIFKKIRQNFKIKDFEIIEIFVKISMVFFAKAKNGIKSLTRFYRVKFSVENLTGKNLC